MNTASLGAWISDTALDPELTQGPPAFGVFRGVVGGNYGMRRGTAIQLISLRLLRSAGDSPAIWRSIFFFFAVCIPFSCCFRGSQLLTEARLNLQFLALVMSLDPVRTTRRPQRAASRSGMVATTRVRSSTVPAYMRTYMQLHAQPDAHYTHEAPLGKTTSINPKSPNHFKPSRAYALNPAPQGLKTWQGFGSMAC